jgi:hypothetical protein
MVQQDKVKSGYDIELLCRKKIFQNLVESMYAAEEIPHKVVESIDDEGKPKYIKLGEPEIQFYQVVVDTSDPTKNIEETEISDVVIKVPYKKPGFDSSMGICCKIILTPSYNADNQPSGLMMGFKYLGLAFPTGERGWEMWAKETIEYILPGVDSMLRQSLNIQYQTEIVPGEIQSIATRIFSKDGIPETDAASGEIFGIYINLLLKRKLWPLEEMYWEDERGNVADAEVFIPEDYDYGIAFGPNLLRMTGTHLKNDLFGKDVVHTGPPLTLFGGTIRETGEHFSTYPVYEDDNVRVSCSSISLVSGNSLFFTPQNLAALAPNQTENTFQAPDLLKLFLGFKAKIKEIDLKAELTVQFNIYPRLKDDNLEIVFKMKPIDIDVSWTEAVRSALSGNSVLSIVFLCLGPVGWYIMPTMYWLTANIVGDSLEMISTAVAKSAVKAGNKKIANALSFLNNKLTFFTKRMSPFYYTHYQVEVKWKDITLNEKGFCAGGMFETTTTFEPKRQMAITPDGQEVEELVICDKLRNENGSISGLIYKVSDFEKVFKQEEMFRPDPERQDEFLIQNDDILTMIQANQLQGQVRLRPEAIQVKSNQVEAIRFHSGLVLTPHEAGHYAYTTHALWVMGYQLIRRRHKLEFFYRAKRDGRDYNNLRSLPQEKLDI